MDPVLKEIYSLVTPYVLGAYGVLWIALVVYIGLAWRRVSQVDKQMTVLEEAVARRS
jgi:hypothetical protein